MILELADNGTCYTDKIKLFDNAEYRKNSDDIDKICGELCKDLPDKEKHKILCDISEAICAMERIAADEFFKEGFKLGLILGAQNFLD